MVSSILFAFISLLALSGAAAVPDDPKDQPAAASPQTPAPYGYSGESGPLGWWNLDLEKNKLCATGTTQSPINIDDSPPIKKARPSVQYPPLPPALFQNLGKTVQVTIDSKKSFLLLGRVKYDLLQFHFHTPSEHHLFDEHFPLEVHLVHSSKDKKTLVLGFVFELSEGGETTELFREVISHVGDIKLPDTNTTTGPLNFAALVEHIKNTDIYQYGGSLTTPPCSEGVTWLVAKNPLPLDVKSYNAIKNVIKFNSRYTQNDPGKENLLQYASRNFC
ncbi:MAG: hypothetical protein M1825_002058 [Sarcosagium campestre]|nr:MAG: hypothetical protein M1825_002058 [Sarcosagium campestre]